MKREYDAIAEKLPPGTYGRFTRASLPVRPSARRLPTLAVDRFGAWLRNALLELAPAHVVTLGQEPWTTLGLLRGVTLAHPAESLSDSRTSGYGRTGHLTIAGHRMAWTPLAHPGLIRHASTKDPDGWCTVHQEWLGRDRDSRT